jgi:uncharacterized membrane protein YtjA (UPF0391 family)
MSINKIAEIIFNIFTACLILFLIYSLIKWQEGL